MEATNFENVIISFARPAIADAGYKYLTNPVSLSGGSLNQQVALIIENVSLADLIRDFCGVSGLTMSIIGTSGGLLIAAAITAALDLVSIKSFPNEYGQLLKLLKVTPHGTTLNWLEIKNLIDNSPQNSEIFEALVKEKFISKKRDGSYIVLKRILIQGQVDFI